MTMKTKANHQKRVMALIDPVHSLFECRVCGTRHHGVVITGGRWKRGTWLCDNGCELPAKRPVSSNEQ